MNADLLKLAAEYDRLCQMIEPSERTYAFLTERQDDGSPHVEFVDGQYHYVVTERGLELERRSTRDIDEILYWLIYDLAFWMGVAFEFKNRVDRQDCRRIIFANSIELVKRADQTMADRLARHWQKTLTENPFVDQA
jgi:RNAse (barnase) inhibitor barstar